MYQEICEVKMSYSFKQKASERPKVESSDDCYKIFLQCFDKDTIEYKEYFKIMLLNKVNKVLGICAISEGGGASCVIDVKQILIPALLANASCIIACHNHPSMNIYPSMDDDVLTDKMKSACKIVGIQFLDHLIISPESYYSYADESRV